MTDFVIQNEKLCLKNDGFCIKYDELLQPRFQAATAALDLLIRDDLARTGVKTWGIGEFLLKRSHL